MEMIDDFRSTFKFECIDCNGSKTIKEFQCTTWTDVVEEFEQFLRGCGYIINGEFVLNKDE